LPNRDAGSKRKLSKVFAQTSQNVHSFSTVDFLVDSWKNFITNYFIEFYFQKYLLAKLRSIRRNAVTCAACVLDSVEAEIYAFDRLGAAAGFIDFDLDRVHLDIAFGDGEFCGHLV
jgi:hypothetical protein